jgi:hypothetical protein
MKNAVSKLPQRLTKLLGAKAPELAMLLTSPQTRYAPENAIACGMDWAADNGFYSGNDFDALMRSLKRWQGIPNCKFVTLPDVWGDFAKTNSFVEKWQPIYKSMGYPVALVAQDGIENFEIQWDLFDAIFVGGTDAFKESQAVEDLIAEANRRGLHTHEGRCNHPRGILRAKAFGYKSYDGQSFRREKHIVEMLPYQLTPPEIAKIIWRQFPAAKQRKKVLPVQLELAI